MDGTPPYLNAINYRSCDYYNLNIGGQALNPIKTKPPDRAPRIKTAAAQAPKELMRRSLLSAKEPAQNAAEPQRPQNEQPEQYAEVRIEHAAANAAHAIGNETTYRAKRFMLKASRRIKQNRQSQGGTEQSRPSFYSAESNTVRQGRKYARKNAQVSRLTTQSAPQRIKQSAEPSKTAAKGTVKPIRRGVRTAQHTVKTAERTVKTTQHAAKAAQRTAQATAKAAQTAGRAAQIAAKAAATATKAAAKTIAAIIKAIISAVKELVAAIAAGGWVAIVIAVLAVLVIALLSLFGVFSANEAADGDKPMTEAIEAINTEFKDEIESKVAELTAQGAADVVEIIYEGDMESIESTVPNWADAIGVYAIKVGADAENPSDVTEMSPENAERLREVFLDMNEVSYRTESETETVIVTDEYGAIVLDKNGKPITERKTTLFIYVNVLSMDYRDGADMYRFNADQNEMLTEIMQPDYYPLFAELLGDAVGNGGTYGLGLDINPDLPSTELGAQIVAAAKKYIGRSYSSMDCSSLVRAAYRDCGLSSMNGLTSTGMAQKCRDMNVLFTDASKLQSGDLIFFARKDASRGEGYCTDARRCGTGKCKRWMQIHHVAIYINGEFLIDSTGGNNSVQIRKHWGRSGSEWEWVCFGRPTN